jgi:hypothetical protein
LPEVLAEARRKKMIFDANAYLRPDDEKDKGERKSQEGGDHESSAKEHAEHGRVDWVTHEAVWARGYELVIGIQARFDSPLTAKRTAASPRENRCNG